MKILVAYDGSMYADIAIEDLRRAGLSADTEALVLCVADRDQHGQFMEAEELAMRAADRLQGCFRQWNLKAEALHGSPVNTLIDAARNERADLIVTGSHGRTPVGRMFLGSVSLGLIHRAACSVRVARLGTSCGTGPIRIVVADDGSADAEAVIRSVAARPWPEQTEARIVSVVETFVPTHSGALEASTYAHDPAFKVIRSADDDRRARLQETVEKSAHALRRGGLTVAVSVIDGDPRREIVNEALRFNADCVFVGTRGLGSVDRLLLGSVSHYLMTHAPCTVEVVRCH